jgi:hypothetical protein
MVIQNTTKVIDPFVIRTRRNRTKKVFDRFLSQQYNASKEKPRRYKKETIRNKQLPRNF